MSIYFKRLQFPCDKSVLYGMTLTQPTHGAIFTAQLEKAPCLEETKGVKPIARFLVK